MRDRLRLPRKNMKTGFTGFTRCRSEESAPRFSHPVNPVLSPCGSVSGLGALRAEADTLKRLQADTAAGLDALLPAILDRVFKGEL